MSVELPQRSLAIWASGQMSECQLRTPVNRGFDAGPTQLHSQSLSPRLCLFLLLSAAGRPFWNTEQVSEFPSARPRSS